MTTLSIEDLKAWLELLPKVTPGPWGVWTESTPTKDQAIDELAQQVISTPDADFAEAVYLLNANGKCPATTGCGPTSRDNAAHLAKCDPATIAALIEGYIAMAEALPALRNKIASEADQYNPPPVLEDDRSDYTAGVQAGRHQAQLDVIWEIDRILSEAFVTEARIKVTDVPDLKLVFADYLETRDEALSTFSTDEERSASATYLHDTAIRTLSALNIGGTND